MKKLKTAKFLELENHRKSCMGSIIILGIKTPSNIINKPSEVKVGWLVGRLKSPFGTKIGYIGDKVLD